MTTTNIIQAAWNTNCGYTAAGQRIGAEFDKLTGDGMFYDIDRDIFGRFSASDFDDLIRTPSGLREAVMHIYLRCMYTHSAIDQEDLARLRALAKTAPSNVIL